LIIKRPGDHIGSFYRCTAINENFKATRRLHLTESDEKEPGNIKYSISSEPQIEILTNSNQIMIGFPLKLFCNTNNSMLIYYAYLLAFLADKKLKELNFMHLLKIKTHKKVIVVLIGCILAQIKMFKLTAKF
jgi:hypothetical protein